MTKIDLTPGQRKALLLLKLDLRANARSRDSLVAKGLVEGERLTEAGKAVADLVQLEDQLELRLSGLQRYMLNIMGEDLERNGYGQISKDTGNVNLNPAWSGAFNKLRAAGIISSQERVHNGMHVRYFGIVGAARPLAAAAHEATNAIALQNLAARKKAEKFATAFVNAVEDEVNR